MTERPTEIEATGLEDSLDRIRRDANGDHVSAEQMELFVGDLVVALNSMREEVQTANRRLDETLARIERREAAYAARAAR